MAVVAKLLTNLMNDPIDVRAPGDVKLDRRPEVGSLRRGIRWSPHEQFVNGRVHGPYSPYHNGVFRLRKLTLIFRAFCTPTSQKA